MTDLGLSPVDAPGLVMVLDRHLQPEDLAFLELTPTKQPALKKMRDSHHALARALASGQSNIDAARLTGFDSVYISIMKADPTFQELLSFYKDHDAGQQADLRERMTLIALDVSSEIRERLHDHPETFTIGELRQLLTNLADRVGYGPSSTVHSKVDITESLSYDDQKLLAEALKELERQSASAGRDRLTIEAQSGEASGSFSEARLVPGPAEDLQPLPDRGPVTT